MLKASIKSSQALATSALAVLFALIVSVAAYAAEVTKTFSADELLANGTIVSLDEEASKVIPSNRDNIANLYGVVVPSGDLEFSHDNANNESVLVANGGVVNMLVSDYKGDIRHGDAIAVSTIAGIGQRALEPGKVIGTAQAGFNNSTQGAEEFEIDTGTGKKTIHVGIIPVKIDIRQYVASSVGQNSDDDQNMALQLASNIAGQNVKPYAVLAAGLVLLMGVLISAFMVTSSGYASLISVGRNPLAEKRITWSFVKLLSVAAGIFLASIALAYFLLRIL